MKKPNDPEYDPRTVHVPPQELEKFSPMMQ